MLKEHTALGELLSLYFHQDWDDFYGTPGEAIDRYVKAHSSSVVRAAIEDIESLLVEGHDEQELSSKFDEFPCYYYPPGAGFTHADWLRWVQRELVTQLADKAG